MNKSLNRKTAQPTKTAQPQPKKGHVVTHVPRLSQIVVKRVTYMLLYVTPLHFIIAFHSQPNEP